MTEQHSKKSKYRQYKDGEITCDEYHNYLAIKRGLRSHFEYHLECRNTTAHKNGFKNYQEYSTNLKHISGKSKSMSENKDCSSYLGVHIAERLLSKIFNNVQRMPYGNEGYDFICNKGYKIDVKSACLHKKRNTWIFHIRNNKLTEYFLLLAFGERENLDPIYIWLIKGDEIIKTRKYIGKLNNKESLSIINNSKYVTYFNKYEQIDKLEKLIVCCDSIHKSKEEDE